MSTSTQKPRPSAEDVKAYVVADIRPILDKYGATIAETFYDAHLKTPDFEIFTVMVIEFKGFKIEIGGHRLKPDLIKFLLKHWDRINEVFHSLDGVTDPFYSDVYFAFKNEFDKRMLVNNTLAYSLVCKRITDSGRQLWSD